METLAGTTVDLLMPATPTAVREARRAVAAFAQPVVGDSTAVELAVSEACTASILRGTERVAIHAHPQDDGICVVVTDHGPPGPPPGAQRVNTGLKLPLIAALARRVDMARSSAGGVTLRMQFSPQV